MKDLDLSSIVDVDGEVLVAEIECDCDEDEAEENCEYTSMPTTESGMVLPSATDGDRHVGPALYHEHRRAAQLSRNSDRVRKSMLSHQLNFHRGTFRLSGMSY